MWSMLRGGHGAHTLHGRRRCHRMSGHSHILYQISLCHAFFPAAGGPNGVRKQDAGEEVRLAGRAAHLRSGRPATGRRSRSSRPEAGTPRTPPALGRAAASAAQQGTASEQAVGEQRCRQSTASCGGEKSGMPLARMHGQQESGDGRWAGAVRMDRTAASSSTPARTAGGRMEMPGSGAGNSCTTGAPVGRKRSQAKAGWQ